MLFRRGMFYAPTACFADEGAEDGGTDEGGGEAAKPAGDTLLQGATDNGKPASEAAEAAKAKEAEDRSHLAAPEGTPERPEFIDEKFWDTKKGEPRLEALAKSQADAVKEANRLRNEADGKSKAPEKAEDYLKDFKISEGDEFKNIQDLKADDQAVVAWAETAKEMGMSQETFQKGLETFLSKLSDALGDDFNLTTADPSVDVQAEQDKLGKNGAVFVEAIQGWMNSLLSRGVINADDMNLMAGKLTDAPGIRLLMKLRENSGEPPIPHDLPSVQGGRKTVAEAQAMMSDDRYREQGPVGDAYRAEVEEALKEAAGTAPISSSAQLPA